MIVFKIENYSNNDFNPRKTEILAEWLAIVSKDCKPRWISHPYTRETYIVSGLVTRSEHLEHHIQ